MNLRVNMIDLYEWGPVLYPPHREWRVIWIRISKDDPLLKYMQDNGLDTSVLEIVDDVGIPPSGEPAGGTL